MRAAPLVLLASAAVAIGGCSTEIDDKKAEKFITDRVGEQTGASVKSVACPSGLTAKKGATFECTVTGADGTTGVTTVTEKDAKGHVSVSAPFIHKDELEAFLAKNLSDAAGAKDVQVVCPDIIVGEKGDEFECQATSGSDKATLVVTQTNDHGGVRSRFKR